MSFLTPPLGLCPKGRWVTVRSPEAPAGHRLCFIWTAGYLLSTYCMLDAVARAGWRAPYVDGVTSTEKPDVLGPGAQRMSLWACTVAHAQWTKFCQGSSLGTCRSRGGRAGIGPQQLGGFTLCRETPSVQPPGGSPWCHTRFPGPLLGSPPRAAPALCPLLLGVSSVWPPGLWDVTTRRPDPDGWEEEECVCLSGGRGVRWRGNRRGPKAGLSLAEKVDAVCGKRQPPEYLHVLLGDTLVIVFRRKRLLYVTSPRNLLWFTVGLCVPLRYPPSSVLTWASKALNRANRSYRRGKEIPCGVPGWRSRLRIWRCHCCGKGLIPGLGTFAYYGCSQKNIYI